MVLQAVHEFHNLLAVTHHTETMAVILDIFMGLVHIKYLKLYWGFKSPRDFYQAPRDMQFAAPPFQSELARYGKIITWLNEKETE